MRRVLSIWLPRLAVERWTKSSGCGPETPAVLTVEGTHGPIIHAVTRCAEERGARAGARLTDARALDPALVAFAADPEGDLELLRRLAAWAGRWSPLVEMDGADSLRLDISGVSHLFGGEPALAEDVRNRFEAIGLTARIAVAPTAAAAWALARHSPGLCDDVEAALSPIHVSALRLDPDSVRTLERLGLRTIGALSELPRLALARRFRGAANVVEKLDQALGRKAEPLTAFSETPPPRADLRLEEPALHEQSARQALERLVPDLVDALERRRLGARRLSLHGFRVDGSVATTSVATAIASRDPGHIHRLLSERLDLDPGFGFDCFALVADWAENLDPAQTSLVGEPDGSSDIARLVDRLSVKLGTGSVRRPAWRQSHVPERAVDWRAAIEERHTAGPAPVPPRPQRLLDRPEAIAVVYATPEGVPRRFVWRRLVHDIARVEGPERIAPEWWRERSTARLRDYYRVEDRSGRRYWIFREGLAGDGRGGAPNWYLHGLFG